MKPRTRFLLGLLVIGGGANLSLAEEGRDVSDTVASEPERIESTPDLTGEEMLRIYGWMAGMRAGLSSLNLSAKEMVAFQSGIAAANAGEELDVDLTMVGPEISQFVQRKFDAHMAELKADQDAQALAFWEEIKAKPEVSVLPSGLAYSIERPGTGPRPKPQDTVRAHYTGRLIDGTVFDSSDGGGPFETVLNRVIEGWTEGLGLIGAGGAIKLYIPAEMGYGDAGSGNIPPGATLIFDVELLEVIPAAGVVE